MFGGAVGSDKMALQGSLGGGAHTSNVDGGEEPVMVSETMDNNHIVVEQPYGGKESFSLVLLVEEGLESRLQLGTVPGGNLIPLVSLPPFNDIAGTPSDWVLNKVNRFQQIQGLTHGGYENDIKSLLIAIEASHARETISHFKKSNKLKRLSWAINYNDKGGSSSQGKTKGRAL
ncbi:hypothetical protein I3842_07G104200 [Carya illinoinensis]|uniref:Uncharacterized protein n=1 Tax=Carya illinoinensis TaxID=32201 RepID=A0A922EKQ7_CARIL|nr:hypothetical protein I3842_07G104200 [Carya illinoinensis]